MKIVEIKDIRTSVEISVRNSISSSVNKSKSGAGSRYRDTPYSDNENSTNTASSNSIAATVGSKGKKAAEPATAAMPRTGVNADTDNTAASCDNNADVDESNVEVSLL